jgi:hypothetical protein
MKEKGEKGPGVGTHLARAALNRGMSLGPELKVQT